MPLPIQLPEGSIVLSNRFGHGPFDDCQPYVRVQLPQGVEIEGIYNAARGATPQRYWLYAFALWRGQRSHTIGVRWAPTEKGAAAMMPVWLGQSTRDGCWGYHLIGPKKTRSEPRGWNQAGNSIG